MIDRPAPPPPPAPDAMLPPANPSVEILSYLARRRSTPVKMLTDLGPSSAEIDALIRLAARLPDHRKLEPWRFIKLKGSTNSRTPLGRFQHQEVNS